MNAERRHGSSKRESSWCLAITTACVCLLGVVSSALGEGYQVIDVSNGGTIKGVASWNGEIPDLPPFGDLIHPEVCGETQPSSALQVNPQTKRVRWVLVYLDRIEKGKAPAEKYWLHMGQDRTNKVPNTEACQFTEHIFPFVRSQFVAMVNFDSILHNPDFYDEKRTSVLNMVMHTPNREIDHTILQYEGRGVMTFQCDIHAHMNGYWAGFHHPYFAVTDADGKFQLSGVPPGKYTLVAWHEGYKTVRMDATHPVYDRPHVIQKEIEVKPNETVDVHFEFPVRKVTIE
jgi:plastocyanin